MISIPFCFTYKYSDIKEKKKTKNTPEPVSELLSSFDSVSSTAVSSDFSSLSSCSSSSSLLPFFALPPELRPRPRPRPLDVKTEA